MTFRTALVTVAILLVLQTSPAMAEDIDPRSDAAWISFSAIPPYSGKLQEFHVRATRNVEPKLLKIISAHVSRSTDLGLLLKSYSDAELKFRSDNFLVVRIDGIDVTVVGGKEFPERATRKLTKQLQAMGFHTQVATPEKLLQRNDNRAQDDAEFVVPFATESQK